MINLGDGNGDTDAKPTASDALAVPALPAPRVPALPIGGRVLNWLPVDRGTLARVRAALRRI